MKKLSLLFFAALFSQVSIAQLKVSILGDSYSTFVDWVPEGYDTWYGKGMNDVTEVDQTWWWKLIDENGLQLEKNDSWSGATIGYMGYRGEDYTARSFITRADRLGSPDIIYIFGGTNDDWANVPLGEFDGDNLFEVRPAVKAMFQRLKKLYPEALILAIINTEMTPDVANSIVTLANQEEIPVVILKNIDKQRGHPSISGMQQISDQVWKVTAPLLFDHIKSSHLKQPN